MRLPLSVPIESRNGLPFSDSYILNGYVQEINGVTRVAKRPGVSVFRAFTAGIGQGMFEMSGKKYAIIGDLISLLQSPFTQTAIPTVTVAGQTYDTVANPPYLVTPYMVLKSLTGMWTFDGTTVTKVTNVNYPAATTRGLAYLDGAYYVKNTAGVIFGSALNDPTVWTALNALPVSDTTGASVALSRDGSYVVSFGENSVTYYWNAATAAPASPLLFAPNLTKSIGCASADSIVRFADSIFFMTRNVSERSVAVLSGGQYEVISTEAVNSILDLDDLAAVYALVVTIAGRSFYLLSLKTTNITFAYNIADKHWTYWASATTLPAVSVALSVAADLTTITGVLSSGTVLAGTFVLIAGATNQIFNGQVLVLTASANIFTYQIAYAQFLVDSFSQFLINENGDALATFITPVMGVVAGPTTAAIQSFTSFSIVASTSTNLVLDSTTGQVYQFSVTNYKDNNGQIDINVVTPNVILGDASDLVPIATAEVLGDKVATTAYLRYSDNDYQSWSTYAPIDMSQSQAQLTRQGSTRRRAYHFRHTANTSMRVIDLVLQLGGE